MSDKKCNHRIKVVKDNGKVYYTICIKCGERRHVKRDQTAIADMAWIKISNMLTGM
jgi:hypothetical protein